ncbi:His/Gly/Thr/Pro-type tRNA ligase C-terminal domain-containing protein, partial [candidate division KSB1 bacterium]|nr:His/Gly/Thr/Pro-type tRNA ligase C-terminal domain-containing protein [candidate division KSB1 bacterium]
VAGCTKTPAPHTTPGKPDKVATPDRKTIAELCDFLKVTPGQTLKAVFYRVWLIESGRLVTKTVMALVRGDYEVNPVKLLRLIHGVSLQPASAAEIEAIGAIPGYAGPFGLHDVLMVVDELVTCSDDLITGANEPDYHYRQVQYGRDFKADVIGDLVQVNATMLCPHCQTPLKSECGVEIGGGIMIETSNHLFEPVHFLNQSGLEQPIAWGWLHFNPGAFLAALAEIHQDTHGLIWPLPVAPFQVHVVMLGGKKNAIAITAIADDLVRQLEAAGIEVLFDDRLESPGVKFNDADLIGIPLRLTLAPRGLEKNSVELKVQRSVEPIFIPLTEVVAVVKLKIQEIENQFYRG